MIAVFVDFATSAACTIIDCRELPVYWYSLPLLVATVVNIVTVLLLTKRDQSVRSVVEWQLWDIWVAFCCVYSHGIDRHVFGRRPAGKVVVLLDTSHPLEQISQTS